MIWRLHRIACLPSVRLGEGEHKCCRKYGADERSRSSSIAAGCEKWGTQGGRRNRRDFKDIADDGDDGQWPGACTTFSCTSGRDKRPVPLDWDSEDEEQNYPWLAIMTMCLFYIVFGWIELCNDGTHGNSMLIASREKFLFILSVSFYYLLHLTIQCREEYW